MNTPAQNGNSGSWLSPSIVLILCFGILVPIAAALVPVVEERFRVRDFRYTFFGPVSVEQRIAFAITVMNRGRVTERAVEVRIPYDRGTSEFKYELAGAIREHRIRDEPGYRIFVIGDLKPEDMVRVSVIMSSSPGGITIARTKDELSTPSMAPRIVSSHGEARWVPVRRQGSAMQYAHQAGFWGFIILVATALVWAITSSRFAQRWLGRN